MDQPAPETGHGAAAPRGRPSVTDAACRPRALIAAAVVALVGLTAGLVLGLGGPSSPHTWCRPLLAELRVKTGKPHSFADLVAALGRMQRQDHAPVAPLISDYYAAEQSGNSYAAIDKVAVALQSLNSACGQQPGAYAHDVF
jgi:hypothetical protein